MSKTRQTNFIYKHARIVVLHVLSVLLAYIYVEARAEGVDRLADVCAVHLIFLRGQGVLLTVIRLSRSKYQCKR